MSLFLFCNSFSFSLISLDLCALLSLFSIPSLFLPFSRLCLSFSLLSSSSLSLSLFLSSSSLFSLLSFSLLPLSLSFSLSLSLYLSSSFAVCLSLLHSLKSGCSTLLATLSSHWHGRGSSIPDISLSVETCLYSCSSAKDVKCSSGTIAVLNWFSNSRGSS